MNQLLQLLSILRARYKVALLVALFTIAIIMAGTQYIPKQYTAETAVMVDVRSPDPIAAILMPATIFPGNLGTQVAIIQSDRVARKVSEMLGLNVNPTVIQMWRNATEQRKGTLDEWLAKVGRQAASIPLLEPAPAAKLNDWIANLMQRGLIVTPSADSNIINIAYRGSDPGFVAAVANAFAQAYIQTSIELKVEPARQYSRWFGDQAKVLRETVEKAQSRLSEFQQRNGIVSSGESMDYELAKLNDLSAKLTAAQGEVRDAESKQRSGGSASSTLPEVMQNPVVQGLRTEVVKKEAKLKEAAGNLGIKNPQYLRMQAELTELKSSLTQETNHVMSGYSTSTVVGKTRVAEIKQAFEAQKARVLKLKNDYDAIAVLVRDVDTAKKAYEAVTNRYNQTNLESQATQTNVTVLSPALAPTQPSFPKPLPQMALIAVMVSILLGAGVVYLLEMLDQRVRSARDLAEMLQLPVLGVIIRPNAQGRLTFWRRSTALVAR